MRRPVKDKEDASITRIGITHIMGEKGIARPQVVRVSVVAHIVLLIVKFVVILMVILKENHTAMDNASGMMEIGGLLGGRMLVVMTNK
mmetsp:Transcript_64733/g.72509  ORF Transcript_64733/g.72509 Transcript_64733/m.72509 type:complete len:88 (-) Transcript_64733:49-312(-)